MNILDSGAGVDYVSSHRYAIPGTVRQNSTAIATANGVVVPPTKCDARIPVRATDGRRMHLILRGALILPDSRHNLISMGKLAIEQRMGA